eukprot:2887489-Pyramimonas_sp.AAC.2
MSKINIGMRFKVEAIEHWIERLPRRPIADAPSAAVPCIGEAPVAKTSGRSSASFERVIERASSTRSSGKSCLMYTYPSRLNRSLKSSSCTDTRRYGQRKNHNFAVNFKVFSRNISGQEYTTMLFT